MNYPRYPFKFNVGFLKNQPIGTSRDIHFEYPVIRLSPDLELSQFEGTARVGRTPQGVIVQAEFRAFKAAECVRCLVDFQLPLEIKFSELYAFNSRSISESGLILPEDGNINLEPLVREYTLLEIPINLLCKPDCKGLCVVCGEDLNVTTCEHVRAKAS